MQNKEERSLEYFHNYKHMSGPLVLGLIVISLGLFAIPWIYTKNKEFINIEPDAPDPKRGVAVIMILPFIWGYSFFILRELVIKHPITIGIEILGWSFIIFALLKYIFDFCKSFGKITETSGIIWFFLFFLFPITIPAMQVELNSHFQKMQIKKKYHRLYN
ncbi:MAG: hypothetical protein ACOC16_01300 [Nanoarchaeota archaeon]